VEWRGSSRALVSEGQSANRWVSIVHKFRRYVPIEISALATCSNWYPRSLADPTLASLFKTYHGVVQVLRSPTVHTLLSASHKHSILRGLRASSTAGTSSKSGETASGTGENNLAFRCTRKRFVIETLHLDAEGGVGERRTSAPPTAVASVSSAPHTQHLRAGPGPGAASAIVVLEETSLPAEVQVAAQQEPPKPKNPMKKKRVAFHSDRPELYDF